MCQPNSQNPELTLLPIPGLFLLQGMAVLSFQKLRPETGVVLDSFSEHIPSRCIQTLTSAHCLPVLTPVQVPSSASLLVFLFSLKSRVSFKIRMGHLGGSVS